MIHFGRSFKRIRKEDDNKVTRLYESVCSTTDIPDDKITYTATKVSCSACLKVLRKRRELEIRNINQRLIQLQAEEVFLEVAL